MQPRSRRQAEHDTSPEHMSMASTALVPYRRLEHAAQMQFKDISLTHNAI